MAWSNAVGRVITGCPVTAGAEAVVRLVGGSILRTAAERSGTGLLFVRLRGFADGSFQYGPTGCISFSSTMTEKKVGRSGVAMQPHLPVLPHDRTVAPAALQPQQLIDIPCSDAVSAQQSVDKSLEITAVGVEIHLMPVCGPVVLGRQEIRESLEAPEQVRAIALVDRASDRVAELLTGIKLERKDAVEVAIDAERTDHVVW